MKTSKDSIARRPLSSAEDKIAVTVFITADETIAIENKRKAEVRPNFIMVGSGTVNKHKLYGIDLLREVAEATKAGQFLLLAIKDGVTYENDYSPVVKVTGDTKYQQNLITAGYKELLEKDIVRRVKKAHYMINPNALIPKDYNAAMKIWNSISTD